MFIRIGSVIDYYKKGKAYGLKALKMFEETVLQEMKSIGSDIAGDIGGEIGSITNYDTGDINGLLDKVNKTKVKWDNHHLLHSALTI